MSDELILATLPLAVGPWQTLDPFLFCVHHLDHFPEGDEEMAPDPKLLRGRNIGMDFAGKDGWNMYHGDRHPGFPQHPHRGFETITIVRQGFIDHSDSLGAAARFGEGDVQWMTAGKGVVHSEMFPLLKQDEPNTLELFQIWLNLPREDKLTEPYFTMLWNESIPLEHFEDEAGKRVQLRVITGDLGDVRGPTPPPNSWASRDEAQVAIWSLVLEPGATWTIPAGPEDANRVLYFFEGAQISIAGKQVEAGTAVQVAPDAEIELINGDKQGELLMLQGRPINEPVAQHGPFVMNTSAEIRQAMVEYQRTQFGGWPWKAHAPVHPREKGRFAIHADGREEQMSK